jgi:hypothetical protein
MKNLIATTIALFGLTAVGCNLLHPAKQPAFKGPPTFSQFHNDEFSWNDVARVVVLPIYNESQYTRAGNEVGKSLITELQSLGRFEVVAAPPDSLARLASGIHNNGTFNEATMLDIARETKADIVLHGTITIYSPFPRPRIGLVLQAVSPSNAKVIASVDGVWDSTRFDVANRIREYYQMRPHQHAWIVNHDINEDDSYSGQLALDSPQLFQRFVCAEAVLNMVNDGSAISGQFNETENCQTCDTSFGRNRKNTPSH